MEAETMGKRLTELRMKRGLSQEALAGELGVSRQSVSKWELDEAVPELAKLTAISEFFDVSLDWLVKGEREEPEEAPAAAAQTVVVERRTPTRKIVGAVLLVVGALVFLFLLFLGAQWFALVYALPFLSCGVVCLTVERRLGIWCAWAAWLSVEVWFRSATGVSYGTALASIRYPDLMAHENPLTIVMSWVALIVPILLIVLTVRSFWRIKAPFGGKLVPFIVCVACAVILWFGRVEVTKLIMEQYRDAEGVTRGVWNVVITLEQFAFNVAEAASIITVAVWTRALIRERRVNLPG